MSRVSFAPLPRRAAPLPDGQFPPMEVPGRSSDFRMSEGITQARLAALRIGESIEIADRMTIMHSLSTKAKRVGIKVRQMKARAGLRIWRTA
jgi:hypothetical protein